MKKIIFLMIFTSVFSLNAQWNPQNLATGNFGSRVHMVNSTRGYLLLTVANQNRKILRTDNGGVNWTATSYVQPSSYSDICFTSENTGYLAGAAGSILKTTDGGNTFVPQVTGTTQNLSRISFVNENTGYASGTNGTVIRTTNAGALWSGVNVPSSDLVRFDHMDGDNVIAVTGLNFFKTTNGGVNWQSGTLTGKPSVGIEMVNSLTGYIAGSSGTGTGSGSVNKTTDGGISWLLILDNLSVPLNGVCFTSENTGYIYGGISSSIPSLASSYIGKTTNGGSNWYYQISGSNWPVTDIFFSDTQTGLAIAFDVISYTNNGGGSIGITHISSNVPGSFTLSQNYPNPFNPVTNIEFSVPKSAFVKLMVFDATGREIETLVSLDLNAGTYKADWNASRYASGVYFYSIEAGEYRAVRKMMLVK